MAESARAGRAAGWLKPLADWAGRLMEGETAKLLRMEDVLAQRLIGQAAAVTSVSDAVRRARAGLQESTDDAKQDLAQIFEMFDERLLLAFAFVH